MAAAKSTEKSPKKLVNAWKLLAASAKKEWQWKAVLWPIAAVTALPLALVSILTGDADPTWAAYASIASILMNIALITSVGLLADGKKATVKSAYYDGTAPFLRFILLILIMVGQSIPFLIGGVVYLLGTQGEVPVTNGVEQVLLGLVWLLFALPSIFWLTRSVFAIFELANGLGPIRALKASWGRVKNLTWPVFGRLMIIVVLLLTLVTLPAFIVYASRLSDNAVAITLMVLQILATIFLLPLVFIYLNTLYRELSERK